MELQADILTGKIDKTNELNRSNKPPSFEQQPIINQTRKILLILIGILLFLFFINFIFVIHSFATDDTTTSQSPSNSSQLVSILISIIYYSFGFLVTYRYYQTGLLVFAWLGFISLLLIIVIVIVILIDVIITISYLGFARGLIVGIIFIIICITASLLQIFAVRYAFRLNKLLANTRTLTIEQI